MADYTRPEAWTKGPPCAICGWPNVKPGHNKQERKEMRPGHWFRDTMGATVDALWGPEAPAPQVVQRPRRRAGRSPGGSARRGEA